MSRYLPNRIGYTGFTCVGYPEYALPAMDCATNHYLNLPQDVERGKDTETFYTDIGDADTTDFYDRLHVLNLDPDPKTGDYINLYKMLIDVGLTSLFADYCYDNDQPCSAPERYSVGSLVPQQPVIPYVNPIPVAAAGSTSNKVCGVVCEITSKEDGLWYTLCCCPTDSEAACDHIEERLIVSYSTCPSV